MNTKPDAELIEHAANGRRGKPGELLRDVAAALIPVVRKYIELGMPRTLIAGRMLDLVGKVVWQTCAKRKKPDSKTP